ncbi:two-component system, NarL family, invasion response regulator UvrY [Bathymodiolus platifrons methanotrophic gill symbiont]|uniref:response regulator transcription factor n=1 Tax=Bathymodiolus platifrons methanotrophic gill symbiont TaxID=113268 RepID=UPI000B418755|nr:response regulator transcription factor [Bathymodiolus platifrons methanotrophic gill symbiont]MCK5870886.1 response regulator transcription factor [Methyloprofundus sp.]TXK95740.1 DNA-binding response regulator [Methylococcaceae bacterium CS4]TXK96932.1 DNA-binding response regulator [Methylococcaceae bacterium CS5]TXL05116.1 DNA-binding response regulator [Methylococcaceae bacterium CS3]TXL08777.1 DNA-binding response regulator [Methylococcaceae bacterium CS1]TXL10078.1 DNA-binding respo
MKIRVILVDDHAVVRAGFKMLLATDAQIEVIAEAERGEQAIKLYQDQQPDIMVMDISMPGIGGLEAIRRICARDNQAKILVFSVHNEQVYINQAIKAGAKGFISKNSAADILIDAIQHIVKDGRYIEEGLMPAMPSDYQQTIDTLSPREFDIFLLLAKGRTAHKISEELCLGYKTVANYSTQIKKKLNVTTVAELAHIALLYGVVNH